MQRIIIICEGQTEREFCKDVLYPYFFPKNIFIEYPLIKKSGGGIVAWKFFKKQIETHLKQDKEVFVTTLIDYYGTSKKHSFPKWDEHTSETDKNKKIDFLEDAMYQDIIESLSYRFIPYFQLHEFEGILFNDINVFKQQIPEDEILDMNTLEQTIDQYPNPELINDHPETAPFKRLEKLILGYNKVVYGSLLAQEIGLERIRAKCPRFNNWIVKLENIFQATV